MEIPRPRTRRPAEERRAQILEAALHCFATKGFHAATMDDLVAASGLSKGSLYWHFEGKQAVFLAVLEAFTEAMFADWDELLTDERSAVDVVDAVMQRGFARLGDPSQLSAWAEFLAHTEARERFAEIYREVRARLAAALGRDAERGLIRPLPTAGLAAALTGAAEGLMLQALVDADFDLLGHWRTTIDVMRAGIAA
jgi:AcrR family transcriptional regulator